MFSLRVCGQWGGHRLCWCQKRQGCVGGKPGQQHHTLEPGDLAAKAEQGKYQSGRKQNRAFPPESAPLDGDGKDKGGEREHEKQIGDIAADDVAHDDVIMIGQHGIQRDQQFRRRCAEGDNCGSDDKAGHIQPHRQPHRIFHQIMTAHKKQ